MPHVLEQFTNNVSTTLNGSINNSVTTVDVTDASLMPNVGNFRIIVDSEIMKVTDILSNALTVERGTEGTTAASHADLAPVTLLVTVEALKAGIGDHNLYGVLADMPIASVKGRIYRPTDGLFHYHDDGAVWRAFFGTLPVVPPVEADFTWVNQGGATIDESHGAIMMTVPGNSGDSLRMLTQAIPSAPYIATLGLIMTPAPNLSFAGDGLILRDSASGKVKILQLQQDAGAKLSVDHFSDATTYVNGTYRQSLTGVGAVVWLQIEDDGTNRFYRYSLDGFNFQQIFSEGNAVYMTPDQIGFAGTAQSTSTGHKVTFISFQT